MDKAHQLVVNEGDRGEDGERYYTPQEIAKMWKVDESTVRKMFIDVDGVLKLGRAISRRHKRQYVTLRIPESVLARFRRERSR